MEFIYKNCICHKEINKAWGPDQILPKEQLIQLKKTVQQKKSTQETVSRTKHLTKATVIVSGHS